jgi:hypothetical protein
MPVRAIEARSRGGLIDQLQMRKILNRVRSIFRVFLKAPEAPQRLMSIEERLVVGPKKSLMLVTCAGRRFLFATTDDSITAPIEVRPFTEIDRSTRVAVIGYLGDKL